MNKFRTFSAANSMIGFMFTLGVCWANGLIAQGNPHTQPLIRSNHLRYQGAFRAPHGIFGASRFGYGGAAIAHNRANDSLLMTGHAWTTQHVSEISIPTPAIVQQVTELPTATVLQPFADVTDGIIATVEPKTIGGLLVDNGQLVWTAYEYYDADGSVGVSHGTSSLHLSTTDDARGMYRVGDQAAGLVAGYMAHVPQEWQTEIGTSHVTGQSTIPIITRTSDGPALFGFNVADLGGSTPATVPLVYYPFPNSLRKIEDQTVPNEVYNRADQITGMAFPSGWRSVLYFGTHGMGPFCYGTGESCGDPVFASQGNHAYPYRYQVWAYDVLDLLQVRHGLAAPWSIEPYAVWELDLPFAPAGHTLGGVAYDSVSHRLFISQTGVISHAGSLEPEPVIHVFSLATAPLPGDYDGNGQIDPGDCQIWKETFGSRDQLQADGNHNGIVDSADYTIWRDALAAPTLLPHAAVPEPLNGGAIGCWLGFGWVCYWFHRSE